jgi:hypothetical protein
LVGLSTILDTAQPTIVLVFKAALSSYRFTFTINNLIRSTLSLTKFNKFRNLFVLIIQINKFIDVSVEAKCYRYKNKIFNMSNQLQNFSLIIEKLHLRATAIVFKYHCSNNWTNRSWPQR